MTHSFRSGRGAGQDRARRAKDKKLAEAQKQQADGRLEAAFEAYEAVLQFDVDCAPALAGRGAIQLLRGNLQEAIFDLMRARAALPGDTMVCFNLANALKEAEESELALLYYDETVRLAPKLAIAHNNRGDLLKELGRLDEAAQAFETALAIEPTEARYFYNLTTVRAIGADAPLTETIKARIGKGGLRADEAAQLHYGLGKVFADGGDPDRSFAAYCSGAKAKRSAIVYDEQAVMDCFDAIERIFTPDFMAARHGVGDPAPAPMFVFGMPRSGTTLVEQILASHRDVYGAGELPCFAQATDCLAYLLKSRGAGSFPSIAEVIAPTEFVQLGQLYAQLTANAATSARRFVDKQLTNFFFVGLMHLALPNARLIHVARNPIDTCFSCFTTLFTEGQYFSYDFGELGRFYHRYTRLMQHWRAVLPAGTMLDLHYEDVVADTETATRALLDYCDLTWDDACLRFHATDRPVRTASATQVRRPIYATANGRWRRHADVLAPLLDALNGDGRES